jgi:hypothetical protein
LSPNFARSFVQAPVFTYNSSKYNVDIGSNDEVVIASFAKLILSNIHDILVRKNGLGATELYTIREHKNFLKTFEYAHVLEPVPDDTLDLIIQQFPHTIDSRVTITRHLQGGTVVTFALAEWPKDDPKGKVHWETLKQLEVEHATDSEGGSSARVGGKAAKRKKKSRRSKDFRSKRSRSAQANAAVAQLQSKAFNQEAARDGALTPDKSDDLRRMRQAEKASASKSPTTSSSLY